MPSTHQNDDDEYDYDDDLEVSMECDQKMVVSNAAVSFIVIIIIVINTIPTLEK